MVTNNSINIATGASGTILRGAGVGSAPTFSTATYPNTAGTSGNVLTSDGTNFVSSPNTGVGNIVLISQQTGTASASITFTSGISATYNTYLVILSGMYSSSNNDTFRLQVSSNGGSSYLTSGYVSNQSNFNAGVGSTTSTSSFLLSRGSSVSSTSTNILSGTFFLYNITDGTVPNIQGTLTQFDTVLASVAPGITAGTATNGTTVNALKFFMNTGNITGKVTLYGVIE